MRYNIDPELRPVLDMLPPLDLKDYQTARAAMDAMAAQINPTIDTSGVTITDRTIPGASTDVQVPVRIYQPENASGSVPGLMHFHGGGFVFGNLESEYAMCVNLCRTLGIVVVSVDYRMPPEHAYPAAVDDCYAALCWTHAQRESLGIDGNRLGVMGQSAGGCLSAVCAIKARDLGGPRICYQYLGIPVTDDRLQTKSMQDFVDAPIWYTENAERSWDFYLGEQFQRGADNVPELAAPARAKNLEGLPPACVTVMEFDPLRDEGLAYAQRLLDAGVSTEIHCYPGTFHGSSMVTEAAVSKREAADMLDALRRGLCVSPA